MQICSEKGFLADVCGSKQASDWCRLLAETKLEVSGAWDLRDMCKTLDEEDDYKSHI